MKKRLLTIIMALATFASVMNAQGPKRELRSTWMATVWAIDWPASKSETAAKKQMGEYLDDLAAHNFNGVCFQVRGLADAMYRSSYEPWNSVLTGTRGKDPGWDPLEWMVEQCHERGLECYAWVNPYRESSSGNIQNTDIDRKWQADGWLLSNGSYIVFNPGMPEPRAHILKVIKEIYTNYAIDGMLFDDYFYPSGGTVENSTAPDWDLYKASGTKLSIGDWRRKNINDFMKEIYDNIQEDRPDMRFGISPAGVAGKSSNLWGTPGVPVSSGDWQYDQIYSDPIAWLHDEAVDFVSPQLYWLTTHSTAPFGPLTTWWSQVANQFGRHFYASHSISLLMNDNSTANWADIAKQVTLHRQSQSLYRNDPGNIFYSAKNLDGNGSGGVGGLGNYLYQTVYSQKALVPTIDYKNNPVYKAPANLKFEGKRLAWDATALADGQSVMRYTVYAIPSTMAFERAMSTDGDGIDIAYLAGVTYKPEFELSDNLARSHYYAVCVYDGYGFESEPAIINYNDEPSKPTTLISPADGASIDWNCTFSWEAIDGADYDLEIASDATFRKTAILLQGIKGTKATVDLNSLKGATTYYWRVFTNEPDRISSASSAATFVTPERPVGNFEDGYQIVNDNATYTAAGEFLISNLWHRSILNGYENFPVIENGALNRGMVATEDYVYITGRSMASADADLYLQVYNAITGEHERDITLSEDGRCGYLPCNDIIKDSNDNICITNLSLNLATTPLNIYMVDVETGDLDLAASLTAAGGGRVDHCGIYGDVASGNFTVFAAVASGNVVYRWFVTNGAVEKEQSVQISEYSPAWAQTCGIAPKVFPISDSEFYLDGGSVMASRYTFDGGKLLDSPLESAAHYTTDTAGNGFDYCTLGGTDIFVYCSGSHEVGGYAFSVVKSGKEGLKDGELMWKIPDATIGNLNSTTLSAPVSIVQNEGNSAKVYVYVPGNGLSAYTITKKGESIKDIADAGRGVYVYGSVVVFDESQDFINAYNLSGVQVAAATSATEVALPGAGTYVVVTPAGAYKLTVK
ncbi:MAG: family 10 glycosylhydrolase [Odoribacter sp.]|nr:family 10 glycosylhydrolase [Odoribacter sp.]